MGSLNFFLIANPSQDEPFHGEDMGVHVVQAHGGPRYTVRGRNAQRIFGF